MSRIRFLFIFFTVCAIVPAGGSHLFAAPRTWVSGTGSDFNSCSRTYPCATFAKALTLTDEGGVIGVVAPGEFGPVTITYSVTIDGSGTLAGILASGTGITVSAGASDTVVLRGLQIEGAGTGHTGVEFQSGGSLYIEKCTISGLTTYGILFEPVLGKLIISDTTIENNVNPVATPVPAAISLSPSQSPLLQSTVTIDRTRMRGYTVGLSVGSHVTASVTNSIISGNSQAGILVNAASSTVLISDDTIVNNGAGLVKGASGGSIISTTPSTNTIAEDSGGAGAPTGTVPLK